MKIRLKEKMDGFVGMILKFCFFGRGSVDRTGFVIRNYDRKALVPVESMNVFVVGSTLLLAITSQHLTI